MSINNNEHYFKHLAPYIKRHHSQIEAKRDEVKDKLGFQSLLKAFFTCECGEQVRFTALRGHYASKKHRRICGDLEEPNSPIETKNLS